MLLLMGANASHWVTLALLPLIGWLTLRSCSRASLATAAGLAVGGALACLARPDGVGLAVLTGGLLAWLPERRARVRLVAAYALVLTLALGAVSLAYAATGQEADWTYRERSYLAFEQGYGHIFPRRITGSPWFEGRQVSERVFGTAEDNRNSVVLAAWRHPAAFAERLAASIALGARLLAVVLSVSAPLLGCVLAGLALRRRRGRATLSVWPPGGRRAAAVGGACLLTLAPYALTFYRRDYFLHMLWVLIAAVAVGAVRVIDAGSGHEPGRRASRWLLGGLVACAAIGVVASSLKVVDWQRQGMPLAERLAVVKALAASTEDGARVWAAAPHLVRHANRTPARVEVATPDSCAQIEQALAEHRPTHVLAEVKTAGTGVATILDADLRQVAVLMERCGLGAAEAIELPPGIRDRWRLFRLVSR
jgi:hypothetical protein